MKILMISTVREFFRQRAGMFFVILGVLLGFMSSREHYSFALFFLTDPFGMHYLLVIWLIYCLLCIQFLIKLWSLPEYTFIYNSRLWIVSKRLTRFFLLALGLLQPLIYYGFYVVSIASQDGLLHRIWPICLYYVLLSTIVVFAAEWRIRHPHVYQKPIKTVFRWPFPRPASWIYWSMEWLLREKALTFLVCKIGAIGIVMGTLLYYSTGTYDIRLPAIGMSLGYLLNIGLSYELYRWESDIWLWGRTLPTSPFRRLLRLLALHALIILPETLVSLRQNALPFVEVLQLYGLGLSLLILFHVYLYKKGGLLEDTMQPVLLGFVVLTLLILYKSPIPAIAGTIFVFSYYKFPGWYRGVTS